VFPGGLILKIFNIFLLLVLPMAGSAFLNSDKDERIETGAKIISKY
jgi:hypothetical protein